MNNIRLQIGKKLYEVRTQLKDICTEQEIFTILDAILKSYFRYDSDTLEGKFSVIEETDLANLNFTYNVFSDPETVERYIESNYKSFTTITGDVAIDSGDKSPVFNVFSRQVCIGKPYYATDADTQWKAIIYLPNKDFLEELTILDRYKVELEDLNRLFREDYEESEDN